jgi:hypothetical protein
MVLSIQKTCKKIQTHTPILFYYILLTHPTITFIQIIKIQNNLNTHIKHL